MFVLQLFTLTGKSLYVFRELEHCLGGGETGEVCADAEASTGTGGHADGGGVHVEDSEGGCSSDRDHCNLLEGETSLAGEVVGSESNCETLDDILEEAVDNLTEIKGSESRHCNCRESFGQILIFHTKKKFTREVILFIINLRFVTSFLSFVSHSKRIMSNPVEDYLEVDATIPGQNWCCLSFISPEKVIKRKDTFIMKRFTQHLLEKALTEQRNNTDSKKFFTEDFSVEEFMKTFNTDKLFEDYLYANESKLTTEFSEQNDFQTCTRGLKIRGTYETRKEAEYRAKMLHKRDPNFHVFVGQVGYWLPWDPNPDEIKDQEYLNDQLNTLMKNYQENQQHKDEFFQAEVAEKKRTAIAENMKRKTELEQNESSDKLQLKRRLEAEATAKIAELRTLADTKDGLISEASKQPSGSNELAGIEASLAQTNDGTVVETADPWMARKKEIKPTTVSSAEDAKDTEDARKKDMKAITKDLFGL